MNLKAMQWKGKITGHIYRIGEEFTTIVGIKRRIAGVKALFFLKGNVLGKAETDVAAYFVMSNEGFQVEEVTPILEA